MPYGYSVSPANLNLSWLRSFITAAGMGSMTAAADVLHVTQPRVSEHIRSLEEKLGAPLLERTASGVRLTTVGETLLPFAELAIDTLQQGMDQIDALRNMLRGTIRVGSYPGANAVLVAPAIERFLRAYPEINFELLEADSQALAAALRRGEIDLAIVAETDDDAPTDLSSRSLCTEGVMAIEPLESTSVSTAEHAVQEADRILVSGDASHGVADYRRQLSALGVTDKRLQITQLPTTLVALVRAGLGVGVLGAFAASIAVNANVSARELPARSWRREVYVATRREGTLAAAPAEFARHLEAAIPQLTAGLAVSLSRRRE